MSLESSESGARSACSLKRTKLLHSNSVLLAARHSDRGQEVVDCLDPDALAIYLDGDRTRNEVLERAADLGDDVDRPVPGLEQVVERRWIKRVRLPAAREATSCGVPSL